MKQALVKFSTKGECPWWEFTTGCCRHPEGPKYCGNKSNSEPSGHCPCEDVESPFAPFFKTKEEFYKMRDKFIEDFKPEVDKLMKKRIKSWQSKAATQIRR